MVPAFICGFLLNFRQIAGFHRKDAHPFFNIHYTRLFAGVEFFLAKSRASVNELTGLWFPINKNAQGI